MFDEPQQGGGVEVLLDRVGQRVELRLPGGGEGGVRGGGEVPAREPGCLGQVGPAELVVLQSPFEIGPLLVIIALYADRRLSRISSRSWSGGTKNGFSCSTSPMITTGCVRIKSITMPALNFDRS